MKGNDIVFLVARITKSLAKALKEGKEEGFVSAHSVRVSPSRPARKSQWQGHPVADRICSPKVERLTAALRDSFLFI